MYLGSHGRANALETLLHAFDAACAELPSADLAFVLVGDGAQKPALQDLARTLRYGDRVVFEEGIPRTHVNATARRANCLVVNTRAFPVYRYGISMNKLFDYLLASRPVIMASNASSNPISAADAGYVVPADDGPAVTRGMVAMYHATRQERQEMGARGREHVLARYSYRLLAENLARELRHTVEQAQR